MSFSASIENIRKALDSSAIVAITDPRGRIKYVNSKFLEISKYSEEELIGQNHRILNSGYHSADFFRHMWRTILSGKKWEGEVRNRAKDGTFYWVNTTIIPFLNHEKVIEEFVSIRWEITDRKIAEEKLLETTENLQSLIDSSFEGLVIYDLSGNIRWCNSSAEQTLKCENQKIVDASIESLLGQHYNPFFEDIQTINVQVSDENKILEVLTKPYFYKHHRAYLVTIKDVTEKSRLESQIIQQDRLASVGILASGLAHEIGTPLGIVRGRAEMVSMVPNLPESVISSAQIIMQQIDRVSYLIQNLLKLARGQKQEQPQKVHLISLLSDVDDFLRYELKKHNIEINLEVPDAFEVLAVYNSFFQVILNLVVNAIHAIQQRKQADLNLVGVIRVWVEDKSSGVLIHVSDNGSGMSSEVLRNLFTPFFSTKEVGKGTGLGLATSYKILQSWGGYLTVESEVGKGSLFTIHMPE